MKLVMFRWKSELNGDISVLHPTVFKKHRVILFENFTEIYVSGKASGNLFTSFARCLLREHNQGDLQLISSITTCLFLLPMKYACIVPTNIVATHQVITYLAKWTVTLKNTTICCSGDANGEVCHQLSYYSLLNPHMIYFLITRNLVFFN